MKNKVEKFYWSDDNPIVNACDGEIAIFSYNELIKFAEHYNQKIMIDTIIDPWATCHYKTGIGYCPNLKDILDAIEFNSKKKEETND